MNSVTAAAAGAGRVTVSVPLGTPGPCQSR